MLRQKSNTVNAVYRQAGLKGVLTLIGHKSYLYARSIGAWVFGKIIELRGNNIYIDGLCFSLESQGISTISKAYFLFNTLQYEHDERNALDYLQDSSLPVVEFGGCLGVVSCLTNKRLRHPQNHVVIEANPLLISTLQHNRDQNQCQFEILNRALYYDGSTVDLYTNPHMFVFSSIYTEHAHAQNSVTVPACTLKRLIDEYNYDQITIICDIEGAEYDLIEHESATLASHVAQFIVEFTPQFPSRKEKALVQLRYAGFEIIHMEGNVAVFMNSRRLINE